MKRGRRRETPSARAVLRGLACAITLAACFAEIDESRLSAGDAGLVPGDDASVVGDAASDSQAPVDGGRDGSSFCATVDAMFCDDFDQSPFGAKWTFLDEIAGRVTASSEMFRSSPSAMLAAFDDGPDAASGGTLFSRVLLRRELVRPIGARVQIDVDVNVVIRPPPTALTILLGVVFIDLTSVRIGMRGDSGVIVSTPEAGAETEQPFAVPNGWFHLRTLHDFATGKVDVWIDGAHPVANAPSLMRGDVGFLMMLGPAETQDVGTIRVFYDNFVLDTPR